MKVRRYIAVSRDENGTMEHWLRRVLLPRPHLEPACGQSRPQAHWFTWNVKRVRIEGCLLCCNECWRLLQEAKRTIDAERGLFDDPSSL